MLTSVYEVLGDEEGVKRAARAAVSDAERVLAQDPMNGAALAMGGTGLAILGDRERFYEWVDRALMVDPDNMIMAYNFACAMTLRLKDHDRAMDLIERRFENVPASLFKAALVDPDLADLRDLQRFKAMIEKTTTRLGMAR
jgi:adenylate cyclase